MTYQSVDFEMLRGDLECFSDRDDAVHFICTHYWRYLHCQLIQYMDENLYYGNEYDPTPQTSYEFFHR